MSLLAGPLVDRLVKTLAKRVFTPAILFLFGLHIIHSVGGEQRGLLSAHARKKVEKFFYFALFVHALREARFLVLLNLSIQPSKKTHSLKVPQ